MDCCNNFFFDKLKEEFIGGCDIVKEMNDSGELLELLNTKGVQVKSS